jgi:hypothetical protein
VATPRHFNNGDDRNSQVPGEPCCAFAMFSDPGGTPASRLTDAAARPPLATRRRLPARDNFGAQSHGFGTGCLRFARWVTRTGRKTRFRVLAKLSRVGLVTRRVPSKGFRGNRYISFPLSQAFLAQAGSSFLPATDLFAPLPHGQGQTILREALLVADHNAYHLGQWIVVRRLLGAWPEERAKQN